MLPRLIVPKSPTDPRRLNFRNGTVLRTLGLHEGPEEVVARPHRGHARPAGPAHRPHPGHRGRPLHLYPLLGGGPQSPNGLSCSAPHTPALRRELIPPPLRAGPEEERPW